MKEKLYKRHPILFTAGVTSLVMILLIVLFVGVFPFNPVKTEYDGFTRSNMRLLEKNGISTEQCEFVGGWRKNYLFNDDEVKILLRFPESVPLSEVFSGEDWRELAPPKYPPCAREKEFGDYRFPLEAEKFGQSGSMVYLSDAVEGYRYLRVILKRV